MKVLLGVVGLVGVASAHSYMTHFHVNGVENADCVRQATSSNPITGLNLDTMACNNVQGNAKSKCKVKGGDKIAMEWRVDRNIKASEYPLKNGVPVGVTDDSHKGPCAIYLKKVDDASTATAPGAGWFKLNHDSVDSAGTFCTDRLRLASAPQPGVMPSNIAPGDYLIRAEMLTLNNAGPSSVGGQEEPQFYVGCAQITVEGTSGGANPETCSIPGYISKSTPGLVFDIWNSKSYSNYPPMFGPAPVGSSGGPIQSAPPPPAGTPTTTSPAKTSPPGNSNPSPTPPPPENSQPPPPENEEPVESKTTAAPSPSGKGRGRGRGRGPKVTTYGNNGPTETTSEPAKETGGCSGLRWKRNGCDY